jgi:hypothetical protein
MVLSTVSGDRYDLRLVNGALTPISLALWQLDDAGERVAIDPDPAPTATAQCRVSFADASVLVVDITCTVLTPTVDSVDTLIIEAVADLSTPLASPAGTPVDTPILGLGYWDLLIEGADPTPWRPIWGAVELRRAITRDEPAP